MSKVKRGLQKLSIKDKKHSQQEASHAQKKSKGSPLKEDTSTYERDFPKSATMRRPSQPTLIRRTSQQVSLTREGQQELYAIEEEH